MDSIPTWLTKKCLPELAPHITAIVNSSLKSSEVPEQFKLALVRPLLKKVDLERDDFRNYRPVSNLSFMSKVLERVVASTLLEHQDSCGLRELFQSAYIKNHSVETALTRIHNDLCMSVDRHGAALLILLDLSAAFDTIHHVVLLRRLEDQYGVEGGALAWVDSYLRNRRQCIVIGDHRSQEAELTYGVPQGSVLGPLLFSAYVFPLGELIRGYGLQFHSYADDTQVYVSFNPRDPESIKHAVEKVEQCLAHVRLWMAHNFLKLNEEKTEIVVISNHKQLSVPSIKIGEKHIGYVAKARNLGVYFDQTLNMENFVSNTCQVCYFHLQNIARIRKYLDTHTAKALVLALGCSRIDFCNAVLSGATGKIIQRLQRVQNAAARVVCLVSKSEHITPLLKGLHWLPVHMRIIYKILVLTFKSIKGIAPAYISSLLVPYCPKRQLCSSNMELLSVPKTKLRSYGDKAFSFYAPKVWNNLPYDIQSCQSLAQFKKE